MNLFESSKDHWKKQNIHHLPNISSIKDQIMLANKKRTQQNLLKVFTLTITLCFMIWIGFYYHFTLISTKIGIILACIAVAMAGLKIWMLERSLGSFEIQNSQVYLKQLKNYKRKQEWIHTTGLSIYNTIISIGLLLYIFESSLSMPLHIVFIFYVLTIAWLIFSWIIIYPKRIKKEREQLQQIFDQINLLESQLQEE